MAIGKTRYGRLREAGKTAAAMLSENRVLGAREIAAAVDGDDVIVKIGDGINHWDNLPILYPHPESGGGGGGGPTGPLAWTQLTASFDLVLNTFSTAFAGTWTNGGSQGGGTVDVSATSFSFTLNVGGWYMVRLATKLEFDVASTIEQVTAQLTSDSAWREWKTSVPVALGGTGNNASRGCWVEVNAGPYFVPAGDEWTPRIDWRGSDTPAINQMNVDIVRLS